MQLRPIKRDQSQFEKDEILKVGFLYRKRANLMLQVCVLATALTLIFGNWISDLGALALILFGASYAIRFGKWERKNVIYLRRMGFTVRIRAE